MLNLDFNLGYHGDLAVLMFLGKCLKIQVRELAIIMTNLDAQPCSLLEAPKHDILTDGQLK